MNGAASYDPAGVAEARRWAPRPGAVVLVCGIALTLAACSLNKRTNPNYCEPDAGINPCFAQHKVCDQQNFRCVSAAGGMAGNGTGGRAGGDDGGGGSGARDGDGAADRPDGAVACPPCTGSKPICKGGACVACASNPECGAIDPGLPVCAVGPGGGQCLVCASDSDCAGKAATPWCIDRNQCAACRTSTDCHDNKLPVCDANHACVACKMDNECGARNPNLPACRADGACVECTKHADCKLGLKPICGPANTCVPCSNDKDCRDKQQTADPGVCMFHADGRCAADGEVLYVKAAAGCDDSSAGIGTAVKPFCSVQRALAAANAAKSVVVVRRGTLNLLGWTYTGKTGVSELTVIGQDGATIGPGIGVGITVMSGKIYIRGLGVTGMFETGIHVPPGDTTLRMDRCVVKGNVGGLFVNGAGFEINNCVFADNLLATIPGAGGPDTEYGGVYVGGVAGKLTVFRHNTVYRNEGPGLVCGGTYPVKGVLVTGNAKAEVIGCTFDPTTSEVPGPSTPPYDPLFDPSNPFHLTRGSSCTMKGTKGADSPPDDLDGNPRPSPADGTSDCGAHEFQQ